MTVSANRYPEVPVSFELAGPSGNAYVILGTVEHELRNAGVSDEEVAAYITEATSGDYDNLRRVTEDWVEVTWV